MRRTTAPNILKIAILSFTENFGFSFLNLFSYILIKNGLIFSKFDQNIMLLLHIYLPHGKLYLLHFPGNKVDS